MRMEGKETWSVGSGKLFYFSSVTYHYVHITNLFLPMLYRIISGYFYHDGLRPQVVNCSWVGETYYHFIEARQGWVETPLPLAAALSLSPVPKSVLKHVGYTPCLRSYTFGSLANCFSISRPSRVSLCEAFPDFHPTYKSGCSVHSVQ